MENMVYILKLLNKYNCIYFVKKSLCKNNFRKVISLFIMLLLVLLTIIPFMWNKPNSFYMVLGFALAVFFSLFLVFRLIDKDYKKTINQPLTMKFLKGNYLIFRIQAIKETLQKEGHYNEIFLNKTLEECDRYLILEENGTSFILKHPFIIIPITIISTYFGSILWEVHNYSHSTLFFVVFISYLIFTIVPTFENRFAKVRTLKFILSTLKNQLKQIKRLEVSS